jgi:hypothetical protein
VLIAETEPVTERLRVREIDDDEGQRLVRIIRRGSGSVVIWRRVSGAIGYVPVAAKVDDERVAFEQVRADDLISRVARSLRARGRGPVPPEYSIEWLRYRGLLPAR